MLLLLFVVVVVVVVVVDVVVLRGEVDVTSGSVLRPLLSRKT